MNGVVGEAPDFETFFAQYKDSVLRAVMVSTGNFADAEDCCAEAFLRAFQRWDKVSLHPSPQAWIARTALNINIDRIRRQGRHRAALRRMPISTDPAEPGPPLDPELRAAITNLPARQRQVIALRIVLGLSGPDTARELGITVGSVSTHLGRALATLREAMSRIADPEPDGYDSRTRL